MDKTAMSPVSYGKSNTRVSLACAQCRSRHVKCCARKPVCSRCQANGENCVYQKSRRGGRRTRRPLPVVNGDLTLVPLRFQPPTDLTTRSFTAFPEGVLQSTTPFDSSSADLSQNDFTTASGSDQTAHSTDSSSTTSDQGIKSTVEVSSERVRDILLDSYYKNFHPAHPCTLPRSFFEGQLPLATQDLKPVLLVIEYIGSLYVQSVSTGPLELLVEEIILQDQPLITAAAGWQVQAILLYSIAVYWRDEIEEGLKLLDKAISRAVSLNMHRREFAVEHGHGNAVFEEMWRRTWWLIYITDAHCAGSTHAYPFRTTDVPMNVDMPCEEEDYLLGGIPVPRMLAEYDMREFSEEDGKEFSSFAQLIGLVRSLDTVFAQGRQSDFESESALAANFDATIMGWCSLLLQSKRHISLLDGTPDEHLFMANLWINTYNVDLHRPLSHLTYCPVESVSRCAPPPPPDRIGTRDMALSDLHTSKAMRGIEAVNGLLALLGNFETRSPFVICMIANTTIAHLSACKHLLHDRSLKLAREKIRLNMGVLKALADCWPLARRTYREVGVIAREVLGLGDQDISPPARDWLQDSPYYDTPSLTFNFDSVFDPTEYDNSGPLSLCGVAL